MKLIGTNISPNRIDYNSMDHTNRLQFVGSHELKPWQRHHHIRNHLMWCPPQMNNRKDMKPVKCSEENVRSCFRRSWFNRVTQLIINKFSIDKKCIRCLTKMCIYRVVTDHEFINPTPVGSRRLDQLNKKQFETILINVRYIINCIVLCCIRSLLTT